MEYQIKEMDIENYDECIELWESAEGIGTSAADSKENIEVFLKKNKGLNFIACDQDKIIGTILCGQDGRRGYLYHLYVLPEYRKNGIGKELVNRCIQKLIDQGITKCHLMFFNDNESGKLFWENVGFFFRDDVGIMSMNL